MTVEELIAALQRINPPHDAEVWIDAFPVLAAADGVRHEGKAVVLYTAQWSPVATAALNPNP